ncbi:MAG: hypothetical protein IKJ19_06880 [Clostridia bacterium]|nr:hypothetical protein [Clostridia bacterium]
MVTAKQSIEYFNVRISNLINSSYILADKKITDLLKTVTTSKLFYELISYCSEGFDYESYFSSLPVGQAFPIGDKKSLIAFTFSLLLAIDGKKQDLLKILTDYYPSENFEASYKLFVDNFLIPFKDITLLVANEMQSSTLMPTATTKTTVVSLPNDSAPVKTKVEENSQPKFEGDQKKYLTCYKDIQKILISEKGKIIHSKHLKEEQKNDLIILLDNFKDCLFLGKKEAIKTSFVSYKYAILAFKKIESEVDDIERILKFCSAI